MSFKMIDGSVSGMVIRNFRDGAFNSQEIDFEYPTDPTHIARADDIRKKLYSE